MRTLGRIQTLARGAFAELPGETVAIGAAMLALFALIHGDEPVWATWTFCAAVPATPLLFALTILRQADRIGPRLHLLLALGVAAAALAGAVAGIPDIDQLDDAPVGLPYLAALVAAFATPLVVTWAAAPRQGRDQAFARFIAELITAAVSVALVAGAALIAGALLFYALHELFGLDADEPLADLFTVIAGVSALVLLHDVRPAGGAERTDEARAIPRVCRRLVTLVGAPFVATMFGIVILYEVVVLFRGEMPSNVLGPLLAGTGVTGFVCALVIQSMLARPAAAPGLVREVGERWQHARSLQVVRILPLILVAVLPLAMWGLSMRVGQHGFTPERVVAMHLLACLGVLGLGGTLRLLRRRGPLSWEIPACAAVFAIVAGFGPLSAVSLSRASQTDRLAADLAAIGIERPGQPARNVNFETNWQIESRLNTLHELGAPIVVGGERLSCEHDCLQLLGLRSDPADYVSEMLVGDPLIDAAPGRVMVIDLDWYSRPRVASDDVEVWLPTNRRLSFRFGDRSGSLDLIPVIDGALGRGGALRHRRFPVSDAAGEPFGELAIQSMDVYGSMGDVGVRELRAAWLLPSPPQ